MLGVEFEEKPSNRSRDTVVKVNLGVGTRLLNLKYLLGPTNHLYSEDRVSFLGGG